MLVGGGDCSSVQLGHAHSNTANWLKWWWDTVLSAKFHPHSRLNLCSKSNQLTWMLVKSHAADLPNVTNAANWLQWWWGPRQQIYPMQQMQPIYLNIPTTTQVNWLHHHSIKLAAFCCVGVNLLQGWPFCTEIFAENFHENERNCTVGGRVPGDPILYLPMPSPFKSIDCVCCVNRVTSCVILTQPDSFSIHKWLFLTFMFLISLSNYL